ncbi:TetR/AcrR family transcriptional regulator [Zavarzinia sp.]|uniref:TetR/AcrR family transcriptional regulator n=1 Tax=Zavarzinia sp. TaxID=2027920 RepID=UPI003BB6F899
MTRREENRENRRRAILAAAKACFAAHGFQGTGMAEIALASGVTPANLYRYFAAKAEIVCAIVDEQREDVAAAIIRAEAEGDAMQALRSLFRHFLAEARDITASRLWLEVLAEVARNPRVKAAFDQDDGLVKQGIEALIQRGKAEGCMARDLDPSATAIWLIALVDGAVGRMVIEPDFNIERATETFLDLIGRALGPRG